MNKSKQNDEDKIPIIVRKVKFSDQNSDAIDMKNINEFHLRIDSIKSQLAIFRSNIKRLEDSQSLDNIDSTQKLALDISSMIKKIKTENEDYKKYPNSKQNELQIRNNMYNMLVGKFSEDVQKFQDIQSAIKLKEENNIKRQIKVANPGISDEHIDRIIEDGSFDQKNMLNYKRDNVTSSLTHIRDKYRDIVKLEKGIIELQQLFNDMAILVDTQGEFLNQIEHSVNTTNAHIEQGTTLLQKSSKLQKRSRRKMCCIIVLILLIVAAIAIVVPVVNYKLKSSKN